MLFRSLLFRRSFRMIETVCSVGYWLIHSFMLFVAIMPRWLLLGPSSVLKND